MCDDGVWAPTCSRPTASPLLYRDPGPPPALLTSQRCPEHARSNHSDKYNKFMPPIFLLGDSVPLFATELFDDTTGLPVRSCSSADAPKTACWWDEVVGRAVNATNVRKIGCYLGASNNDLPEFFQIFVAAAKKIGIYDCRHVKANPTSEDVRCVAEDASLILLSGGNPPLGWRCIHSSGLDVALRAAHARGAVLVGISAGAMHIGTHVYSSREWDAEAPPGGVLATPTLGLLPFFFGAHEEENAWRASRAAIASIANECDAADNDTAFTPFIALGLPFDSGVTVHEDGSVSPIGRRDVPILGSYFGLTGDGSLTSKHIDSTSAASGCGGLTVPTLTKQHPGRWRLVPRTNGSVEVRPWLPPLPDDVIARLRVLRDRLARDGRLAMAEASGAASDSYRGPNKYCNVLIPGKVIIGCFPCSEVWRREGRGAHKQALASLCAAGVTLFVCLDDSEELVSGRGTTWARPRYLDELGGYGGCGVLRGAASGGSGACKAAVFATEDGGAFDWGVLCRCLERIVEHILFLPEPHGAPPAGVANDLAPVSISDDEPAESQIAGSGAVYCHCFGGHGRAGVVAACLMGLGLGYSSECALAETQARHDAREDPAWPLDTKQPSPQTDIQRVQVEMLLAPVVPMEA